MVAPQRPAGAVYAWVEKIGPARSAATGTQQLEVGAYLNATPRTVFRQVVSSSAEMDAGAWGLLLLLAFLLFDVYAVASLMAVFMIYSISRAVNRIVTGTILAEFGLEFLV